MTEAPPRHGRAGLIVPLALFAVALAAWTGWWFYLAREVESRVEARAAAMRQAGWTAQWSSLNASGWPFRVRLEARDFVAAAPSRHAVAAPRMLAEANAYNPLKWVLIAPDGLTLTRAEKGRVDVSGRALRMSVHGLDQPYPNVAVELVEPVFTAHAGAEPFPISRAERAEFYLRPHLAPTGADNGDSVDILLRLVEAEGRDNGPVQGVAQNGRLSAQIEAVVNDASRLKGADAEGVFANWIRAGGRFTRVRGQLSAGESRALLSSDSLSADADGRLVGSIALRAEKPMQALAGLARSGSGAVNRGGAAGAAAATSIAGGEGDVALTLEFRDGRSFLGPFPLAPAPKLF